MAEDRTNNVASGTLVLADGENQENLFRVRRTKLLVISGPLQGREFVLNRDTFTIGSGNHNDLIIEDSTVSKRHCEIVVEQSGYLIRDRDSTNGTFVQGVRVSSAHLAPGSEIQLGKTRIVFCPLQEAADIPLSRNEAFGAMLGRSVPMRRIFYLAETYSPADVTVMITGETGTGKEILAEEIHNHSSRRDKPFIVIDCAAISKELIESELFGHVKGAFTGANADRQGAFELADGGTVFLDEIGDLSPDLQPKLLRVLEKREIKRVGCNKVRKIDVRIISATNRNLANEVNEGRFREDLYYRLSVVHLELPPLRRRREDVPLLVKKFLTDLHGEDAINQLADFDSTMDVLKRHEWPGNVRELRNLIELAFYSERRPVDLSAFLSLGSLRAGRRSAEPEVNFVTDRPFKDAKNDLIEEFERTYLNDLLARNKQNISRSAREAGIERAYLQRLIRKYGMRD
ncbi:MAG: sigma 54-interacting transcriptional regulator [Kiritimatiellae bacterium]|jgi:transcriptional regulator with GAF, ATPase, and Fis domain|nr:sigma 54-interacting transcriptional regulator [Kiritimatiellia bacterium]MDD2346895.1 sigma 54-interacting transcriptional regulator [Kiritimatiellia bacterium]MDD3583335.1 sigma 54-interacting transcriptional regulator [Kiritimatiellia bacterium]HHU15133.1 sigma 54-interacting transcriptional regulator [Lentisphaerota bacterium]